MLDMGVRWSAAAPGTRMMQGETILAVFGAAQSVRWILPSW